MNKTELKQNITKIGQLLNSDSYESGIQLLITMNDQKLNNGLADIIQNTLGKKYFQDNKSKEGLETLSLLCPNLTTMNLYRCESLTNINVISEFTDLTTLSLSCYEIKNIDSIAKCKNITTLSLSCCYELQNLGGLINLTNLTSIDLSWCVSLLKLDDLANIKNLTTISFHCCYKLHDLNGLSNLKHLKNLDLSGCKSIQNMDILCNLPNLSSLNLDGCVKAQPAPTITTMTSRKEVAAYQKEIKKLKVN